MEVKHSRRSKRLHRHALPVVMVCAGLTIAAAAVRYSVGSPSAAAIAQGLLSHGTVHLDSSAGGLGKITLATSAASTPVGASLVSGPAAAGSQAGLTLSLEAPTASQP